MACQLQFIDSSIHDSDPLPCDKRIVRDLANVQITTVFGIFSMIHQGLVVRAPCTQYNAAEKAAALIAHTSVEQACFSQVFRTCAQEFRPMSVGGQPLVAQCVFRILWLPYTFYLHRYGLHHFGINVKIHVEFHF